ncbi:MAG: AraC family transcriptional regulator [Ruminococcaceae bacterium]|nr:AraC family transcriptional regulator [Oscillospiraceae bacterium]
MLYQKMLLGEKPYSISKSCNKIGKFEKHRHPEIEFNYCIEGEYSIVVDNEEKRLKQGDLIIIGSMESHEFPGKNSDDCRNLVFEVGPVFLLEYFNLFVNITAQNPIIKVDENNNQKLFNMFNEIIALQKNSADFSDLTLKGNLYKICAYIIREFQTSAPLKQANTEKHLVANIEKALELIQYGYAGPLRLEDAAKLCGYSKGSFCKTFKYITGDTFHSFLNKYRIKMACTLLELTDYCVDTIAGEVGFTDAKSLCRAFKSIKGMTTGEYRKEKKKK